VSSFFWGFFDGFPMPGGMGQSSDKGGIYAVVARIFLFFRMDATKMSCKDCELDIAMVTFGLHELHEDLIMRILEKMGRMLKGSERLYIIDYESEKGFFKKPLFWIFLKLFEPEHMYL